MGEHEHVNFYVETLDWCRKILFILKTIQRTTDFKIVTSRIKHG